LIPPLIWISRHSGQYERKGQGLAVLGWRREWEREFDGDGGMGERGGGDPDVMLNSPYLIKAA